MPTCTSSPPSPGSSTPGRALWWGAIIDPAERLVAAGAWVDETARCSRISQQFGPVWSPLTASPGPRPARRSRIGRVRGFHGHGADGRDEYRRRARRRRAVSASDLAIADARLTAATTAAGDLAASLGSRRLNYRPPRPMCSGPSRRTTAHSANSTATAARTEWRADRDRTTAATKIRAHVTELRPDSRRRPAHQRRPRRQIRHPLEGPTPAPVLLERGA